MPIVAIPNISVGRASTDLDRALSAVTHAGGRLLDVHTDEIHGRSVLTVSGDDRRLVAAMTRLASACSTIDLRHHQGTHPRLGVLDVCPFVPHLSGMDSAIALARETARRIADETNIPVFLYGEATRDDQRDLPALRRGGLDALIERVRQGLAPDEGPREIDPRRGVICVGARGPLIAFNVWVACDLDVARVIAGRVRDPGRIRALGLPFRDGLCQVSMNLIAPDAVGIVEAFTLVDREAVREKVEIAGTEIVGLVEDRYLPAPDAKATRLLIEPGRSLGSALQV